MMIINNLLCWNLNWSNNWSSGNLRCSGNYCDIFSGRCSENFTSEINFSKSFYFRNDSGRYFSSDNRCDWSSNWCLW